MVNPAILSRLEIKTSSLSPYGGKSFSALSNSDIAASLGYIGDPFQQAIISYCYWPSSSQFTRPYLINNIQSLFKQEMCLIHKVGDWAEKLPIRMKKRGTLLDQVSYLILSQLVGPPCCYKCEGHGQILADLKLITCRRCEGKGVKALNSHEIGKQLKVRTQDFLRFLAKAFDGTYDYASMAKTSGLRKLSLVLE